MKTSKLLLFSGCAGAVFGIWLLTAYVTQTEPFDQILLETEESRLLILDEYGQTAAEMPPVTQEIRLPEGGSSSQVYDTYCQLQTKQNLPLAEYAGQEAVIRTYTLAGCSTHKAELICSPDGLLLGAMLYDSTEPYYMYPLIT